METKLELLVLFMIGGINWKLLGRLRRRCSSDRNGRLGVNCQWRSSSLIVKYHGHTRDLMEKNYYFHSKIWRVDANWFQIYFYLCISSVSRYKPKDDLKFIVRVSCTNIREDQKLIGHILYIHFHRLIYISIFNRILWKLKKVKTCKSPWVNIFITVHIFDWYSASVSRLIKVRYAHSE